MDFIQLSAFLLVSFVLALIPTYLLTFFIYTVYDKYWGSPKKDAAVEKAREEGRAVTAHLVKRTVSDNDAPYSSYCKYEFVYNDKKYHKKIEYLPSKKRETPPETMEFYFRKSPKHAKLYKDFGKMETETKYVFLVSWCIIAIMVCIFLISKGS